MVAGVSEKKKWGTLPTFATHLIIVLGLLRLGYWLTGKKTIDLVWQCAYLHAGTTPLKRNDAIITVEGTVTNLGEMASVVRNWGLTVQMAGEAKPRPLLWAMSVNNIENITLNTPQGAQRFSLAKSYLPDITATDPITQGGAKVGIVMFDFANMTAAQLHDRRNKFTISFEDVKGEKYSKECTLNAEDTAPLILPGVPRPDKDKGPNN
jgi:hypothetical protein